MNNNYHFFKHLETPLNEKLKGKELLACFSQEKDELVIGFGDASGDEYIRCSVLPAFSGLYFPESFHRAKRNSVDLWQEFIGKGVEKVSIFSNERALGIFLSDDCCLVLKMYGNRSNILAFKGQDVVYVFNGRLKDDENIKLADLTKEIDQSFEAYKNTDGAIHKLFPTWGKLPKAIYQESFKDPQELDYLEQNWKLVQSINRELEDGSFYIVKFKDRLYFSLVAIGEVLKEFTDPILAANAFFIENLMSAQLFTEKGALLRKIQKETKSHQQYINKATVRLKHLQNAIGNMEIGHILMANLHAIPERSESIELQNFTDGKTIKIKLKKDLTPQKNAENYYRKAKKEKIEIDFLEKNIKQREADLMALEIKLEAIEEQNSLRDLRKYAKNSELAEPKKKAPKNVDELFKSFEANGYKILIGKNSKNNDLLTLKYANKNDLWLHAKDVPGSHVVIKDKAGSKTPNYVIERAAGLAAWFSKRKTDSLVPVMVTPKKYVRKIKGSLAGQVTVSKESVVIVAPIDPLKF